MKINMFCVVFGLALIPSLGCDSGPLAPSEVAPPVGIVVAATTGCTVADTEPNYTDQQALNNGPICLGDSISGQLRPKGSLQNGGGDGHDRFYVQIPAFGKYLFKLSNVNPGIDMELLLEEYAVAEAQVPLCYDPSQSNGDWWWGTISKSLTGDGLLATLQPGDYMLSVLAPKPGALKLINYTLRVSTCGDGATCEPQFGCKYDYPSQWCDFDAESSICN